MCSISNFCSTKRLLTAKTYEMHMFHSASLKLGLERAVLSQNREQSEEGDDKLKKKSDKEAQAKQIDELLKKGAYDVFRDEDDAEAEKFMETDIDQLLEHSSKKVTYGASATSSLGSPKFYLRMHTRTILRTTIVQSLEQTCNAR